MEPVTMLIIGGAAAMLFGGESRESYCHYCQKNTHQKRMADEKIGRNKYRVYRCGKCGNEYRS